MASYLTQEDVQNFGHELVDFSQRAAVHAVAPHLQELHWLAGRDVGVRYFGASTQNICSAATRLQRGELWAAERSATCTHRAGVS